MIVLLIFLIPLVAADLADEDIIVNKNLPLPVKPACMNHLGCFNMTPPWVTKQHPQPAPLVPHLMAVRVFFHQRPKIHQRNEILTYPFIDLRGAKFNSSKMTFFLTHGFQNTGEDKWLHKMKNALLNVTDANVMVGQWGAGAKVLSYIQAVGNTRLAAREFSNLFQYLIDQKGLNVTRFHCIGHSLGAQICGLIGKSIPGIFQITALDPAQPLYNVAHPSIRLGQDDAAFVVGVHSDARIFLPDVGFGYMHEVGHVDFYINTAHGQPMCQYPQILSIPSFSNVFDFFKPIYTVFLEVLLCPHQSAVDVFTESIQARTCIFWGHAVTMSNLLRGVSNTDKKGFFSQFVSADDEVCNSDNCSPMGLTTYFWPARGTFVLITRGNGPYCIYEDAIVNVTTQRDLVVTFQSAFIHFAEPEEDDNQTVPFLISKNKEKETGNTRIRSVELQSEADKDKKNKIDNNEISEKKKREREHVIKSKTIMPWWG